MARRKVDVPVRISMTIPANLLTEIDGWKRNIENMSRSELISKLVRYALDHNAIDKIFPEGSSDQGHPLLPHRGEVPSQFKEPENQFHRYSTYDPTPKLNDRESQAEPALTRPRINHSAPGENERRLDPRPISDRLETNTFIHNNHPKTRPPGGQLPYLSTGGIPREGSENPSAWTFPKPRLAHTNEDRRADGHEVISSDQFFEKVARLHQRIRQI